MTIMFDEQFLSFLPDDAILAADEALARYGRNMTNTERKIAGAVRPTTAEQVANVVRVAATNRISLYPISQGNNWGYGSSTPIVDDCIVLDLSKMKRIELVDEVGGIFSIEPGVTQQDLFDFLKSQSLDFLVPTTGAGPDASIVGNALERGFGMTPITDHWSAVVAIDAVLPDGSRYLSPLAELGGAPHPWGVGPYLDGLFSQGAFGVIVQVHLRLAHRPESVTAFLFEGTDLGKIGKALADIQKQRLSTIWGMNILNTERLASMTTNYPSDNAVLSASDVQQLRKVYRLKPWNVLGVLAGPHVMVRSTKKFLSQSLRQHGFRARFLSMQRARKLRQVISWVLPTSHILRRLEFVEKSFRTVCGEPTHTAHKLLSWRANANEAQTESPIGGEAGLLWFCPLVPLTTAGLMEFVDIVQAATKRHSMNPLITLSLVAATHAVASIPLTFCRLDKKATAAAYQCFHELTEECAEHGLFPYRLPMQFMSTLQPHTKHAELVDRLKQAIDPNHILSPGRYCSGAS